LMVPVLEALAAAHKAGVIHRDVKPANVFVCCRPRAVKLLDFGVSRFGEGSGLTGTGQAIGTPRYMAPEQVRGDANVGPGVDLFSVGAVLYALLSGRPPHGSGSSTAVLAHVLSEPAEPLRSVAPMVPPPLCAVVDGLLEKDPGKRPADALAVRDALLAAVPAPDLSALYEAAEQSHRAAAVAPTPTSSKVPVGVRRPTAPTQRAAVDREAPTTANGPAAPAGGRKAQVLAAGAAVALGVMGAGAFVLLRREPAPPPVPVKPAMATVTLAAEPSTARILVDDVDLGCNPCKLAGNVGESRKVRVRAAGHVEAQLQLKLETDRTERVVLSALPPGPAAEDAGGAPGAGAAAAAAGVSVVVSRTIKPGHEADYEAWLVRAIGAARTFPGHLGADVVRPAAGGRLYVLIFRFDSEAHLDAWETSPARAALVAEVAPLSEPDLQVRRQPGLETWFNPPDAGTPAPPVPGPRVKKRPGALDVDESNPYR
jgi:heme-degrading monooxygenase HmoA